MSRLVSPSVLYCLVNLFNFGCKGGDPSTDPSTDLGFDVCFLPFLLCVGGLASQTASCSSAPVSVVLQRTIVVLGSKHSRVGKFRFCVTFSMALPVMDEDLVKLLSAPKPKGWASE